MPIGFGGGLNWTHPLLQQINRQGDIIQYADQAGRENERLAMQKKLFKQKLEDEARTRALNEAMRGALTEMAGAGGKLDLNALAGKVAPYDPKTAIELHSKAAELENKMNEVRLRTDADTQRRNELTKFQEESLGLRRDAALDAASARSTALSDRAAQAAAMDEHRREMRRLEQERLEETKKKNLRDEQGTKPPEEYRWNENKELEPIPGSKEDVKVRESYAADVAGVERVTDTLTRVNNTIDDLLKNDNGLKWVTGYSGYAPDWVSQSKKDATAKLEELKSKVFVQAVEAMRTTSATGSTGLGQLTEREGDKIQASFANLEKAQSYDQLKAALKEIQSVVNASQKRIGKKFEMEWTGREPRALGQKQDWKPENLDINTVNDLLNKHGK